MVNSYFVAAGRALICRWPDPPGSVTIIGPALALYQNNQGVVIWPGILLPWEPDESKEG